MRNLLGICLVIVFITLLPELAKAETPEEQRRIEQLKREFLSKIGDGDLEVLKKESRLVFDYGGWINYRYDGYRDDDNDSLTADSLDYSDSLDFRFWVEATLRPPAGASYKNQHSLYIRFKDLLIERYSDSLASDVVKGYDQDGPHLDYAYLILDLRPYNLEIGRRYFSVGQGIAYSNANDGLELSGSFEKFNLKTFVSQTLPREENIDTSVPGWEKESDRAYYGFEGTYLGISNHGIYGYFLIQRDESDEDPEDIFSNYTYDSEYIGLGSQGKITPSMHYWAEIIRETGYSHVFDTDEKKRVNAWGGDFGASYDWEIYSHPNFSLEYAFGTGDSDRLNVTNTFDGNISGEDRNFLYFGYLPTGYALSPRLSNLHFYKAGVLFKPLEKYKLFKNLTFGMDYYRYYKYKKEGGIYDSEASLSNNDIGSEIDLETSWQIMSDLSCSIQYGHFRPGDAYPGSANDREDYISTSVTLTF